MLMLLCLELGTVAKIFSLQCRLHELKAFSLSNHFLVCVADSTSYILHSFLIFLLLSEL